MKQLYCQDVLFSVWTDPMEDKSSFAGLLTITQTYEEGYFLHSCQLIDAWVRAAETRSSLYIREMARGPAGSFDSLRNRFEQHFENGSWLVGPQPDTPRGQPWYPPIADSKLLDSHGSFINADYLDKWIERLIH